MLFNNVYNDIKHIIKDNKKVLYISYIISMINKYSSITFLENLLIKINIKDSDDLFNLKFNNKIKYYKNDKKINDIKDLIKSNKSNKILIEYNNTNCNLSYNNNNVILLNPFEYGLIGFNWINELFYNNISLINSKNKLKICNIDIYFSDFPIETIDNNYIENIALIKAISELRKNKGIINYINDIFDTFYLNNSYLNKNVNYINWYKDSLNFNLNRYYSSLKLKDLLKIEKKYNLIYCNLQWKRKTEKVNKNSNIKESWFLREYQLLPSLLYTVIFSLLNLEKNGSLILKIYESHNKSTQDLLVILKKYFKKVFIYRPKIISDAFYDKYIIYEKFNKNNKELIKELIKIKKEFDKNDSSFGLNFNIKEKDRKTKIYKEFLPSFDSKLHTDYTIDSFLDEKDNFYEELIKFDKNIIDKWIKYFSGLNNLNIKSVDKLNKIIKKNFENNLEDCIKYCKKYNLKINNEYLKNNNKERQSIAKCFPEIKGIDRYKIQFMDQSIYYISEYHNANFVNKIIENIFKNKKDIKNISVIDATSHIGGNTIPLGLNGFNVTAIEINENIYNLLNMNIKLYKLKIKTICKDFIKFIPKVKHDVVFIDAPWGGTSYKKLDKLELYLSNMSLVDITNKLKKKSKVIILKVPFNYDIQNFIKKNNFSRILQLFSLERYYLIVLMDESLKLLNLTL